MLKHLKEVFSPKQEKFFAEVHCEFIVQDVIDTNVTESSDDEIEDETEDLEAEDELEMFPEFETAPSKEYLVEFIVHVVFQKVAFGIANQKFGNDLNGAISKEINRAFVDIHMNHPEMAITLGSFEVKIEKPVGIEPDILLGDLRSYR